MVGASESSGKLGSQVLQNLVAQGYRGDIYPVNPSREEIFGRKCYPDINSLPVVPDLSLILIPAEEIPSSLEEHARKGIKHVIVMSAGFKEADERGRELEEKVASIAKQNGIRIVGPNCLGVYDNVSKLDTFFLPRELIQRSEPGVVSLASQSGSFVGHLMDLAEFEHLGIARVITFGNKVDVDEVDALYYYADDPETKIVGLYLENVRDGREFLKAAEYCTERKPVIVLKGGRSGATLEAVASHTGALGGNYTSYRAAFRKAKLLEVESETGFLDACKALSSLPPAKGKRVLILGHAGGMGIALADLCVSEGLVVPEADSELESVLKKGTLFFASVRNPVDLTASGTDEQAAFVLEEAFVKRDYADLCIYLALWGLPQSSDAIGETLRHAMDRSGKPIVVATLTGKKCLEKRTVFESNALPVFFSLERAARVAKQLVEVQEVSKSTV